MSHMAGQDKMLGLQGHVLRVVPKVVLWHRHRLAFHSPGAILVGATSCVTCVVCNGGVEG